MQQHSNRLVRAVHGLPFVDDLADSVPGGNFDELADQAQVRADGGVGHGVLALGWRADNIALGPPTFQRNLLPIVTFSALPPKHFLG